ncbi:TIGR00341 family protein [Alkalibacillus salilacus]|uniref:Hydrophobic protein (TIGR00341 family) n=1 Tax=Alkalibacillus salilacus TaxID=284582 RepID=A0ABT9VFZ3_9BACI|nr:TIGR00341 family protein [Alkalibacillus salilacus]MDQ0159894.1 putative hydrophobic protein (TIGR00341 family) [Alkalibacillus salilacus]
MSMQLIEVYIPKEQYDNVKPALNGFSQQSVWKAYELEDRVLLRMIVDDDEVEDVLDYLEAVSTLSDGFETILFPVNTYISRETIEKRDNPDEKQEEDKGDQGKLLRASRQELMHMIEKKSQFTMNYTLLIVFSAMVATGGFINDSEAVVIGAMAIAPLIGPAISVSFAAVLGDVFRLWRALLTLVIGFIIIVIIAAGFGFLFEAGTQTTQYTSRTVVSLADVIIALASGAAGALALLNRVSSGMVGVMVAVALLPPTVTFGISIGQTLWIDTYWSFLLIMTNVTCIFLSGIIIFFLSGIRPMKWKEEVTINVSRLLSFIVVAVIFITLLVVLFLSM